MAFQTRSERSKCEWPGNPGQRNAEPYLTDDDAAG